MADVITRLKVESSEYDNKIKRAQQGLLNLEQEVRKTGTTFSTLSREQVNYIQSLGRMETSSRNAKGKIGELGTAFTELSLMYKRMTDQEKASPAGKAMSQSLDQLKTRVQDAKKELADIDKELKNTSSDGGNLSSVLDSVAGKFGLNTSMIKSFSGTLGAAVVAVKVAKDAFFNSEEGIDEWGRTVEASQTIYEAFLYSLNKIGRAHV